MANKIFKTIDDLSNHIAQAYQNLTDEIVQSITGFSIYRQCHLYGITVKHSKIKAVIVFLQAILVLI